MKGIRKKANELRDPDHAWMEYHRRLQGEPKHRPSKAEKATGQALGTMSGALLGTTAGAAVDDNLGTDWGGKAVGGVLGGIGGAGLTRGVQNVADEQRGYYDLDDDELLDVIEEEGDPEYLDELQRHSPSNNRSLENLQNRLES